MHVLVVEDNRDLAGNLIDYLTLQRWTVDWAADGRQALNLLEDLSFDVIVLDIMMPGPDGLEVCRILRERKLATPILFLTARDALEDKLEGFTSGGDDYLVKPFAMKELTLRLDALAKRRPRNLDDRLVVADLEMDIHTLQVRRGGRSISLNRSCMTLLRCLMSQSPNTVSRQALSEALWGDEPPERDVLRSHLYHLRSAIDKGFDKPLLHTVHGVGLRLAAEEPSGDV